MNLIARARKAVGLTQKQTANALGCHWITVSKLERGEQQLTQEWAEKLSAVLDVPASELFVWQEKEAERLENAAGLPMISLDYLDQVLERTKLSPHALAKKAGVSPSTLTRPISGTYDHHSLSLYTLQAIGDVTGYSFIDFLLGVGGPEKSTTSQKVRVTVSIDGESPRSIELSL